MTEGIVGGDNTSDAPHRYIELQVATNFSFLRGASHPHELVDQASRLGYDTIGISDFSSVAGMIRAYAAAEEHGIRIIPGARLTLDDGTVLLAYPIDRAGWAQLCRLITIGNRGGERKDFTLSWSQILRETDAMVLVCVPDGPGDTLAGALHRLAAWRDGGTQRRAYLALTLRRRPGDVARLHALMKQGVDHGIEPIVTGDVLYHAPDRHVVQDLLTAIREICPLDELGDRREAYADRALKNPATMERLYAAWPQALANTQTLAAHCRFSITDLRYQYPSESDDPAETPHQTLTRLVRQSLRHRYPAGTPKTVLAQLKHELDLIGELEYAPYFLTVYSIVEEARRKGILCQGRGSAANSAVCYVLGITAIDPVRSGLLFERFISAERREPPDIDVDFESDRREEMIQWIYSRYGRQHAALCATVQRYRAKGAIGDVGKALGLPRDVTDLLSRHMSWSTSDGDAIIERARELNLNLDDRRVRLTLQLAGELINFPRQLGTHPGGFVLTADRLDELVPLMPTAMEDRQIIVWDKDDIDILKFMKVDVLGLGMLGCLRRAFEFIDGHDGRGMDMATIPPEDPETYAMISRADTLGTFQIESRAQMAMLPRMKPQTFYDLVVQVAIVRPGPIQGDMVHPYLRRREGLEKPKYPKPELERVLGKTLGVPLFQEQAMQVAIVCAGFPPGEADQLRRAMATFKSTGGVTHFRDKLINGMVANGYQSDFAERTFAQLEGFGSYGFPESHAASFALIAYASSYIKCHHPDVFCAALLNAQPMGFYAPAQIVRDARAHGVEIRPICVNQSRWDCTLEPAGERSHGGRTYRAVRLGLRQVKGLSNQTAVDLILHRTPLYDSIDDVWQRSNLSASALECLAEADAFAALGVDRRSALWQVKGLSGAQLPLFEAANRGRNRPEPESIEPVYELAAMSEGREVVEDYASTGLTLRQHPLTFLRGDLAARGMAGCGDLANLRDGARVRLAGLVLMRQRPGTAKGVMFLTIEDETGIANLIVWKSILEAQRAVVLGASLLGVRGTLQREGEVMHVIVKQLEDLTPELRRIGDAPQSEAAPLRVPSRDFR